MPVSANRNVDSAVVRGFGKEWSTFRQDEDRLSREQRQAILRTTSAFSRGRRCRLTALAVPMSATAGAADP